ncbi:MAG: methionyl-tRNA formyltransferase [Altibacter sp.]|uniref:methionyl-tRNA formyltransferase n=1 Tax=Altibacter sp. TaxID=2024823 RepID=UPI001DF3C57D|nr:methionyl-tRNA formyltransferase [Altibacter sp.]MBZ0327151.1 methionyl-tRNA formyltransferase [Altibacter sp.]
MRDIRIVFMGTPHFAVGVLQKLVEEGKNIVGVITAPDKPAGRGRKLRPSAVKVYALSQALPILQPTNLKDTAFLEALKGLNANLQIVVAFRMLPKVVWSLPEYGTFNLHASLLPNYRGAAPINWAIINGETKTGVTTFFIDDKIDTGEIILQDEVAISPNETAGTLHDTLMHLGSELVLKTVSLLEKGPVVTQVQKQGTHLKEAPKLHTENTRIDWKQAAAKIDTFIRGLSPYPGAWSLLRNGAEELVVKIHHATVVIASHQDEIGSITATKKEMKISVKNGYLYIEEMQLAGKRKMAIRDLLNGYSFDDAAKML